MDSSEEDEAPKSPASPASSKASGGSSSSGARKAVPIEEVKTLGQMARLAPALEKRLQRGELRSRELCEVACALGRSKYFDAGLFEHLSKELRRVFERRSLGTTDTLNALCSMAELNAYNADMFEAACAVLKPELAGLPDAGRLRLEAALKQVNHRTSDDFLNALRKKERSSDGREACPMFFRGQCKWGPKCKLSHDSSSFDSSALEGKWRPPSSSGGKSVGYKQSSDLFKADRCGALW